ncbi:hypothetical protein BDB00DRAFT_924993 [Zychaea mexicana]|uniref:uncharacterized protein n=1 Tax=Zychaea mexicana TaxID=64656 RepID=UPI0022FE9855|nr:uncharacterized protein BDB00DRAFT_924993 [Zychaea mexicana]KAI9498709.1 hypothetical protein BDB00DRAFT_924993 [Zychaea mexicana]
MSGTSMATPYVSGCIALYMQATGSRSPSQIFRALFNHAKPVVTQHHPSQLESPIKQGAGLIQIHHAIRGETTVSPYKLELNDTQFFKPEKTLRMKNSSHVRRIYQLEHLPAAAISVPRYRPLHVDANATVEFETTQLTLEPNATQLLHVRFSPPKSKHKHLLYGGYIKIYSYADNRNEEQIHVPYLGALDNQRDLPIFDTMRGYPRIEPANKTRFSFQRGNDTAHLHIRLGSPTARLRSVLVNQENKRLGTLVDGYQKWVSRNDHSDSAYTLDWRGKIIIPPAALIGPSATEATGSDGPSPPLPPPSSNTTPSPMNYSNIIDAARINDGDAYGTKSWSSKNNIRRKVVRRHVPPGRYKIRVSALKIFGDPLLQNDWEIWYSPEFEVID